MNPMARIYTVSKDAVEIFQYPKLNMRRVRMVVIEGPNRTRN